MLYYRRKILLALLEIFGGRLGKIDLQKLLFLFTKNQEKPDFYFLPYLYGCYSYQAVWDLGALRIKKLLGEDKKTWILETKESYLQQLKPKDEAHIMFLFKEYQRFSTSQLIHLTYSRYPYYAINSKVIKRILSQEEQANVIAEIPQQKDTMLYTIGYEGISLEQYFNKLILADVKVLCDVRRNPYSQKFGFSKTTLQEVCKSMGIKYKHIPELGIASEQRQNLKTQKDYNSLFASYKKDTLPQAQTYTQEVLGLLENHKRIALTCFEAHHCQCHRGTLATHLTSLPEWNYELKHL